jgi:hypothetical protein
MRSVFPVTWKVTQPGSHSPLTAYLAPLRVLQEGMVLVTLIAHMPDKKAFPLSLSKLSGIQTEADVRLRSAVPKEL